MFSANPITSTQLGSKPSTPDTGFLQVRAISQDNQKPIEDATVQILDADTSNVIEEIKTNKNGITDSLSLPTPPLDYSLEPSAYQPYATYEIRIQKEGFEQIVIDGAQILPTVAGEQDVAMLPLSPSPTQTPESFVIGPHTLYGDYPPKIPESEIKPIQENGEIVLSRVVIPEYVIVHDGPPSDRKAKDYYVPYRDYIKNVASSEIYATWPEATITANVLAIMSFTLNRVYTEWYRGKGYQFTITSSTAYDHKWINERTIYDPISVIVDSIFNQYLSRPNVIQPILTQYCDGKNVKCPNWMTQWGSKTLGDQGYTSLEILRNFYGDSMYINQAEEISGIPASWPGYDLTIGTASEKVRQIQEQLNRISDNYPAIPKIAVDGVYGEATANSVKVFQSIFGLPQTGVTDFATWYKISAIYVAVTRIAELNP